MAAEKKHKTFDFGGLQLNLKSLSLGHPKPGAAGNLVYDGDDDSITLPGILNVTLDTQTGAGAISVATTVTLLVTDSADALTLADGTTGQLKVISMITDAGDGTLTPANFGGGSTLTFDDVGDYAILIFDGSVWQLLAGTATVA